jgi:hypothetical protein
METVERITLFKIPKEEHRAQLVEEYKQLVKTAVKVPHLPFTAPQASTNLTLCRWTGW